MVGAVFRVVHFTPFPDAIPGRCSCRAIKRRTGWCFGKTSAAWCCTGKGMISGRKSHIHWLPSGFSNMAMKISPFSSIIFPLETSVYIYIYVYMVPSSVSPPPPPPPWVGSPGSSPNSLLFASYWQHFWGPASYLLGLCSISDYQPRIY